MKKILPDFQGGAKDGHKFFSGEAVKYPDWVINCRRQCNSIVPKNQIELVSLKIFIFGQVMAKNSTHAHILAYVFCHNSPIFGLIGLKFVIEAKEIIIYGIDFWWKFKLWCYFLHFWFLGPLFGGKWAWPLRASLIVWGRQTRPKLARWVDLLGQPLSRNYVFELFRVNPTPLMLVFVNKKYNVADIITDH